MKILVNPLDQAEQRAAEQGQWVVATVETRVSWPLKKQIVTYDGKDFLLLPQDERAGVGPPTLPAIALRVGSWGTPAGTARADILRFASAMAWTEGSKIEVVGWGGGGLPRSHGIVRNAGRIAYLETDNLPVPTSDAARNALAFYREGVSLDNPFYAFLSLYKAFSVAIPDGRQRGAWMSAKRSLLDLSEAKARALELEQSGHEMGAYLFEECRHAVAHADREPFVNPDNLDDHNRLYRDLPLMRNLAEIAIEECLGIKREATVYREHLYELEGFKRILPAVHVQALKRGEQLAGDTELDFPECLLLAVRGAERFALPNMTLVGGATIDGGLILDFVSAAHTVSAKVALDFANEKLIFDPVRSLGLATDRTVRAKVEEELKALLFQRCILSNGHLEIWNRGAEKRLGRSEVYIPLNSFVNDKFFTEQSAELNQLLAASGSVEP